MKHLIDMGGILNLKEAGVNFMGPAAETIPPNLVASTRGDEGRRS